MKPDHRHKKYISDVARIVNDEAKRLGVSYILTVPLDETGVMNPMGFKMILSGWTATLHKLIEPETVYLHDFADNMHKWPSDESKAEGMASLEAFDVDTAAMLMLDYLRFHFDRQIKRKAAAEQLGFDEPLSPNDGYAHVRIDRWVRDRLMHFRHDPTSTIGMLLNMGTAAYGITIMAQDMGMRTVEFDSELLVADDGTPVPFFTVTVPVNQTTTFDGHSFEIAGATLPETVMGLIVGRPVGDVADLPTDLASRTIERVERWYDPQANGPSEVLKIWVKPDPVKV